MLNLNLNTVGAGAGKNDSNFDPRLFFTMLEDFYTASLIANTRLDVVISGSTIYNEPRYYSTTLTSSATPSTQQEFIVVAQTTYLIERDSEVSCSFQGFPKWDPVQFGDPSLFSNVTMSLEIPTIGFSTSSYGTGSLLTHEFIAQEKGIYFVDAKVIFNDYYNSTINEHFFQSGSYQTSLSVTGSFPGFLTENDYTSSTSGLNNKLSIPESASVDVKFRGVGEWGIINAVPFDTNFSQSLVTMSLETPWDGFVYHYNTASFTSSFTSSNFQIGNDAVYNITASVNTKNPFIPIEYLIVGGGQFGLDNAFGGNDYGGGGGDVTWGIINLDKNTNSITASAGNYGPSRPIGGSGPEPGIPSYMYWGNNTASANGGQFRTRVGICGTSLNEPTKWVDGQIYGANGIGGEMSPISQSQCNKPSSSYVPNSSGVGADGDYSNRPGTTGYPQPGVVAIRYYDPNNFYSSSLSGSGIVTNVSGGYHYHYFTGNIELVSNISTIKFHFEEQESIVDIDSVPTASAIQMDYLLVGGGAAGGSGQGGGGGAGALVSGSTTIPANGYFNTTISIGDGGPIGSSVPGVGNGQGWQGTPGFRSRLDGTLQAFARGGGGAYGNSSVLVFDGYGGASNPGGGSGGGGSATTETISAPFNWFQGNPGGVGQRYRTDEGFGGGGGGASQAGRGGELQGGFGGSGSMWLDGNFYAGGGAGGRTMGAPLIASFTGGPGGGGRGAMALNEAPYTQTTLPGTGSANTGGGGGGAVLGSLGAAGGSGVAIFRLLTSDYNFLTASNHITTGSNIDTYTSSSYTFIRAKNDSNLTIFNSIN
jgi:hypothetical protein